MAALIVNRMVDKLLWVDSLRNKADGLTKRLCAARYNDFFVYSPAAAAEDEVEENVFAIRIT